MRFVSRASAAMTGLVLAVGFAAVPAAASAQGAARVIITVYQKGPFIATLLTGAAVCFSSTDNTKITSDRGVVVFDRVPAGNWSAVAWKSGFKAKRVDIAVPSAAVDVRATVTIEAGTERSPCVLPAAPAPEPPPPSPPAPAGDVAITVKVMRADRTPIANAKVCVGSSGGPSRYDGPDYTTSTGRAYFSVPKMYSVLVTASASGFTGADKTVYLPTGQTTVYAELTLAEGSGGKLCPDLQ